MSLSPGTERSIVRIAELLGRFDQPPKRPKLRPVLVDGKKGWFHEWGTNYNRVELLASERPGLGIFTVAIIEFEDGAVSMVPVDEFKFTDTKGAR